ncbi:MAG: purine-nucleoside phosphorylase [Treponema sp.]|jgi:purine-nucleoside phosphorylase|nr:purine-nucleoside phosphorylase [Treponema sp.]
MHDIYKPDEATPHNSAKMGDFAKTVLMPGDPLRAKYFAENYLENVRELSGVRNMLAYTGTCRGKPLSVMGSGMGGPSIGIYSFELFNHYGVENIIRIGTCGGLLPCVEVGDLVFALAASSNSNYAHQYKLEGTFSACADYSLLEHGVAAARSLGCRYWVGNVFSSDLFSLYSAEGDEGWQKWARLGCGGTDMESYALYCNAAYLGKRALTILTCSDSNVTGKGMSAEERQTSLKIMFEIGLSFVNYNS